jgi:hypothetical protein
VFSQEHLMYIINEGNVLFNLEMDLLIHSYFNLIYDTNYFSLTSRRFSYFHPAEHQLLSYLTSMQTGFVQKSRSPKPDHYLHFMELQTPGTPYRPLWMEENINNVSFQSC